MKSYKRMLGRLNKKLSKMVWAGQIAGIKEHSFDRFEGIGPIGRVNPVEAPSTLTRIISTIIGILTVSAIIYFIFQIIFAGYSWISAGGDAQKIGESQKKIYSSILGIFVVLIAVAFVSLVGFLFGGIDFLNLEENIRGLAP